MAFEPLHLESLSELKHEFFSCEMQFGRVLVVLFSGNYRFGSAGNGDARFMKAMIRAGLSAWPAQGLLLDLAQLKYEWGDEMAEVLSQGFDEITGAEVPTTIVVSDLCAAGLRSLLVDELQWDPEDWMVISREDGLASLQRKCKKHNNLFG